MGLKMLEKKVKRKGYEIFAIMEMIERTPRASKREIEKYHTEIIKRLDSGEYIDVSSLEHRNLHQMMWMKGHEIYENLFEGAYLDFISKDSEHRMRFDIWYAKKYILDKKLNSWGKFIVELENKRCGGDYLIKTLNDSKKYILDKKLNLWEREMVQEASRECWMKYKHPLEEITESEVLE